MSERESGLPIALKIITAPRAAFEILSVAPTWGWAFLISVILGGIGTLLSVPSALHSVAASLAHQMVVNPAYSRMSDAQRHQVIASTLIGVRFGWAFVPFVLLISAAIQTLILLIFNAIGRGSGNFKTLWASIMNIAIPGFGLYLLAGGIIAVIRGPGAYNSATDTFLAMPSLAWLVPHAGTPTVAFLSTFNPFSIWAFALTALAMVIVARATWVNAYLASALILVLGALVSMWGGSRS